MERAHLSAVLLFTLSVGCTSDVRASHADPDETVGEDDNAPPSESTLCELQYGSSLTTDVLAVLGRPDATRDDRSGPTFDYLYDRDSYDDVMLTIVFAGPRFKEAQLSNLAFPQCWSDDIAELRRKKLEELDADLDAE